MMKYLPFLLFLLLKAGTATAQNNLVVNGIPWFDDKGNIVNAHGACIVEETEDIIFSENGNRTKVTLSPASHVILRMIL